MPKQIVKQPNGKYAIWSTVVDDFVCVECDLAELIDQLCQEEMTRIHKRVTEVVAGLDLGRSPYHQFTKTWDECIGIVKECHGDNAESLGIIRESGMSV